jgi:flagellar hook-associated protein 2
MAGITGIGTGMDIDGMVKSMVAAEQAPKQTQLANLEKTATTKITSVGSLKSAISAFQTALEALRKPDQFQARAATSSNADTLSVTADATAGAGSYNVNVSQLASSSKVALASIAPYQGRPPAFGNGTLNIKVGENSPLVIAVDASNNTLTGMRDAINKAGANQGLSATIVTDTDGSRLVLSSTHTGKGQDISVSADTDVVADNATGVYSLDQLEFAAPAPDSPDPASGTGPAARMITRAKDAELTIDGLSVTSKTNTVSNAIEGVTLNLKAVTDDDKPAVTVGVDLDKAGVKANVKKFVDAYNKLMGVINTETKVTSVGEGNAPLTGGLVGDATARSLVSTIRNELVNGQGSGAIRNLTDLGITTQKDGTLAMEGTKLDKALSDNFGEIADLFAGDKGLATRLDQKLKPYSETGGILEQRNKSMTETLSKVKVEREDLARRMASLQERLYKQFNAMDTLVSQLSNTSSSLAASLDSLPWATSNKS